jgi:prevent-host-death family protein
MLPGIVSRQQPTHEPPYLYYMTNLTTIVEVIMATRISLAEAKAKFSAVVDDVRTGSRRYLIERHGRPAAAIVSVEELEKLEALDKSESQPLGFLALVGAWGDLDDAVIDEMVEHIYRTREEDLGRPVELEP